MGRRRRCLGRGDEGVEVLWVDFINRMSIKVVCLVLRAGYEYSLAQCLLGSLCFSATIFSHRAFSPLKQSIMAAFGYSLAFTISWTKDENISTIPTSRFKDPLTSRLQTSASNQKPIDIRLLRQLLAVLLVHTTTVYNPHVLRRLLRYRLRQPLTNRLVHLLRLFRRGDLACANGPNRFIGNNNLCPIFGTLGDSLELTSNDFNGLIGFPLLEGLSHTEDSSETTVKSGFGFPGDKVILLPKNDPSLAVACQGPSNIAVFQLLYTDLPGECSIRLVEDVL